MQAMSYNLSHLLTAFLFLVATMAKILRSLDHGSLCFRRKLCFLHCRSRHPRHDVPDGAATFPARLDQQAHQAGRRQRPHDGRL